jgi:hypothetical protein
LSNVVKALALLAVVATLSGCSAGSLLNGKAGATQAARVPVGNDLALPPDLALRAPGATTDDYVPNGRVDNPEDTQVAALDDSLDAPAAPTRVAKPIAPVDNFTKYGISKTNPDGTPKNPQQLNKELKAAILAEKRKNNPGYGTIFNIGSIFTDG